MFEGLAQWWADKSAAELIWLGVGLFAQLMFSMRFLIQWVATERARASIVPETFWYFSFLGGLMLLSYAIHRMDPVFIIGQATGLIIYSRNIYFIWQGKNVDEGPPEVPIEGEAKPANKPAEGFENNELQSAARSKA
jgi:lipid-A-disaccharide synthase-like uncharacterized protein